MSELKSEYKKFYKTLSAEQRAEIPSEELPQTSEEAGLENISLPSPEDEYIASLDKKMIEGLVLKLDKLPERNRTIFLKHLKLGYTPLELSQEFDLSLGRIHGIIDEVRKTLIIELKIKSKLIVGTTQQNREDERVVRNNRIASAKLAKPKRQATLDRHRQYEDTREEFKSQNQKREQEAGKTVMGRIKKLLKGIWRRNE